MKIYIEQLSPTKSAEAVELSGLLEAQEWVERSAAQAEQSTFKIVVFANGTMSPAVLFHPRRMGKEALSQSEPGAVLDFRTAVKRRLQNLALGNFVSGSDIPRRQRWAERARSVLQGWPA